MSKADHITPNRKKSILYSDFTFNFDKNPITGDIAKVTNEESVKRSIMSLVMTRPGERFFRPDLGSGVQYQLFNFADDFTKDAIERSVAETIRSYEPRAVLQSVSALAIPDREAFYVSIVFSLINTMQDFTQFNFLLTKVR